MPAGDVIKQLIVKLTGDDKQLVAATTRASAAIKRVGKRALQAGAELAKAGALGTAAIGTLVYRQIAAADEAGKTARAIGVEVETLTAMQHAAGLAGLAQGEVEKGLGRLARGASDAAQGLLTQKQAFESINVAVTDNTGRMRSQRELLADIADRFAAMEDGTRKTALAQEIFGRVGTKMIPLLNEGSDGLAAMTEEARRLGIVIDDETYQSAAAFRDNLTRLKGAFTGVVRLVMQNVLPILVDLSNRFVDAQGKMGGFEGAVEGAATALRGLLSVGSVAKAVLGAIGDTLGGVAGAVSLALEGRFRAAFGALKDTSVDVVERVRQSAGELDTIWTELGENVEAKGPRIEGALISPIVQARTTIKTEAERAAESVDQILEGLAEERDTVGMTADELLRYKLEKLGATEATIAQAIALQREVELQGELAEAAERTRTKQEAGVAAFGSAIAEALSANEEAAAASVSLGDTFASAMAAGAQQGTLSFKRFADAVVGYLKRILVQALLTRAVAFLFPGIGSIAATALSGRQGGGPVMRGTPYLVGERGPEVFVPAATGAIVPQRAALAPAGALLHDRPALPPYPQRMTPGELAVDSFWREFVSAAIPDALDRGVRFQ